MTLPAPAILVVDDDSAEVQLITRAFRKAGFENAIYAAHDGQSAIRYLQGDEQYGDRLRFPVPGVVILDHKMPGSDGWEVLEWVRRKGEQPFAVVVFSGSNNPNDERKALELGANAYHVKPQDFEQFMSVIKTIAEFWVKGKGAGNESAALGKRCQGT